MENNTTGLEIAIIGMSGRFPGADNANEFWNNLKGGVESISFFTDDELEEKDLNLVKNPNYVKARGMMNNIEYFDAEFFKYSPRVAALMDPQLRVLHECAWEALEDAGYNPHQYDGPIGSYIAATTNLQWVAGLFSKTDEFTNYFELETFNTSEFYSTRLSYNLNLKGPSYTVQTACSSSLVSIHLACQALLCGECDMALAGGVSISEIKKKGYLYAEGMIHSPDGHCRAFDEEAKGTIPSSGAGIIVLKRLEDAISDKDNIYAVIKGSAINNDGCNKVGYTAPSVEGEAKAIKAAQYAAEIEPESIGYVETHGTGTVLGDPIEIEGLKLAFNLDKKGVCPIGSVKSNIGHLGYAAGVTGVIKTALSIKHKLIPPSINYKKPNPKIDFNNSPFFVNAELAEFKNDKYPLRAGVSSFGIGGTNAHIILEEAPKVIPSLQEESKCNMILLSARTESALDKCSHNLSEFLMENKEVNLKDIEYTLQLGRKHFKHRKMFTCSEVEEAIKLLDGNEPQKVFSNFIGSDKKVIFMFPGQGSQYINMGLELYENESIFRNEVDKCFSIMNTIVEWDIKKVLFSENQEETTINETFATQPIIFIFEYALAKLLMELGIKPNSMIGHSIGEYVAACISGVLSLEDALKLVSFRGELMQKIAHGSMISIAISEEELIPLLNNKISLAAVNSSLNCVASGTNEEIDKLEEILEQRGYKYARLHTSHAFHSTMMETILESYKEIVDQVKLNNISIPYLSNLTGDWINDKQVIDSEYWINHLRGTVKFNDGLEKLLKNDNCILIEVGPGKTLSNFVKANKNYKEEQDVINIIRHPKEKISDYYNLLKCIGILWVDGIDIDWAKFHEKKERRKVSLPTYPFERQCFINDKYIGYELKSDNSSSVKKSKQLYARNNTSESCIAPRNELEQKVAEVFENCLGYDKIGINENFFDLGVDSLKAITIVGALNKNFEVHLNQVFEYPTIEELAKHIVYKKDYLKNIIEDLRNINTNNSESSVEADQYIEELENQMKMYNSKNSMYEKIDISNTKDYKNVLLTGATGYLGIYLLRELLENTSNILHLIIRGRDINHSEQKLKDKIKYYFGDNFYSKFQHRIVIFNGSIEKENLGLPLNVYEQLCHKIDCIIHSAANANHYGKYSDFFETNVKGTSNVLELCKIGKKKDFHHISTFAVFENARSINNKRIITEYDFDLGQECTSYYAKSKFEAEKLVIDARKDGINSNIFRVGYIMFDSVSGKFQVNIEQNGVYSIIKAFNNIGVIPQMERDYDFSFVDYVSKAIVLLFDKGELNNEIYHVYNPNYVSLSDLLTIKDLGLNIKMTTFNEFLDYVDENYDNDKVYSCISVLRTHFGYNPDKNEDNENIQHMRIADDKTILTLKRLGFEWCEVNADHMKKMIDHCKVVNFI